MFERSIEIEPSGIAERELERKLEETAVTETSTDAILIVGRGRLGGSIAKELSSKGAVVEAVGRELQPSDVAGRVVLLCVPDDEIPVVAERFGDAGSPPALIGHTSGATGLLALDPAGAVEGTFSLHPLQTVPDPETDLTGAPAAIAGSTPQGLGVARELATRLGMVPFEVDEESRILYHAAASVASNFLVTLQQEAAALMERAGVTDPRAVLAPLVRRSLDNWVERGPEALTGPVARGDTETVERHREALSTHSPELLELYDLLAERTARMSTKESSQ